MDGERPRGDEGEKSGATVGEKLKRGAVRCGRSALAVAVCLAIIFGYAWLCDYFGWKHNGGYFPMAVLCGTLWLTWRTITGKK